LSDSLKCPESKSGFILISYTKLLPLKVEDSKRKSSRSKADLFEILEEETLSDLDLTFDSDFVMGVSLKSTRQGLGTQKNLDYEKLKQLLGLDIDKELKEIWANIRRDLSRAGGELAKISAKSQGEIKNAKYRFPVIQKIGKRYGTPVQELAVDKSVKLFNALPKKKRLAFLEGFN